MEWNGIIILQASNRAARNELESRPPAVNHDVIVINSCALDLLAKCLSLGVLSHGDGGQAVATICQCGHQGALAVPVHRQHISALKRLCDCQIERSNELAGASFRV